MRMTLCLQIASETLSPEYLQSAIGYKADKLTLKGADRSPPRAIPNANLWNGSLVLEGVADIDEAVMTLLEKYPEMESRLEILKNKHPDISCTFYISMRPFSKDFILFLDKTTVNRLSQLGCDISLEYFDNNPE